MLDMLRKSTIALAAVAAAGFGGAAIAGAAADSGSSGSSSGGAGETALTGTTKEKVEAAALAEYSGAKIVRTETNNDSTAPYESHITTSGGKSLEVLVSMDFEVVDAR